MRQLLRIACPLAVALLVAGCGIIQSEQGLIVHPDGTAELTTMVLLPIAVVDAASSDGVQGLDFRQVQQAVQQQFPGREVDLEEVEEGDRIGYRARVRFERLEEAAHALTAAGPVEVAPGRTVTVPSMFSNIIVHQQGGLLGKRYTFHAQVEPPVTDVARELSSLVAEELSRSFQALGMDATAEDVSQYELDPDDPELQELVRMVAAIYDIRFSVTLPGRIDPGSVRGPGKPEIGEDGRTVTWRLPVTEAATLAAASDASLLAGFSLPGWVRRIPAALRPAALLKSEWALPAAVGLVTATALTVVASRLGWWRDGPGGQTGASG